MASEIQAFSLRRGIQDRAQLPRPLTDGAATAGIFGTCNELEDEKPQSEHVKKVVTDDDLNIPGCNSQGRTSTPHPRSRTGRY